ncbi:hypothetical protein FD754_008140, partial [Muntiacus muntjak]
MRQNFIAQFIQSGIAVQKNWALSIDQCWLQVLQFLVHLINLLSILLKCNGFAWIQKVVVDQMSSRPPNSDYDLFLVQIWLWEGLWSFSVQPLSCLALESALELLLDPITEMVVTDCH